MGEALARATQALDLAEDEDEFLEAAALKAGLELDLGKVAAARRTLEALPPAGTGEVTPLLALEFAHLHLGAEQPDEARRRFQALVDQEPELADAWYGLGLAAEEMGDEPVRRRAWLQALTLDERAPLPDPLLPEREMAEVAERALGELPERARTLIENVPILITDLPSRPDVERGLDPRLLGLFEGTSYPEGSSVGGPPQVARILLFRKNLERVAGDVDELRAEIRTTLLHETGHFFGMSEEDLVEVGLD
jgi:predicted Zn-dependent protease with MMP-like domain